METIFYNVKGTFYRSVGDESNLIIVDEIFEDANPIIAREAAFNLYQSYIDVFLESRGKVYISHDKTKLEIQDFTSSYKKGFSKIGIELIDEIDIDFDKGLSIYLVMDGTKTFITSEQEVIYEDKHLIHYIDNGFIDLKPNLFEALLFEYSYYEKYGFIYKNHKRDYDISRLFDEKIMKSVLETPVDFTNVYPKDLIAK